MGWRAHTQRHHTINHCVFVLGGGEFSCDQVSPKKAIPMAPKPKSWMVGCGVVMGAGRTGGDANVLECKLVSWCWTLLTSQPPHGRRVRMEHHPN